MSYLSAIDAMLSMLLQATLCGGVLVIVVLGLRAVPGRRLHPGWICALWLIVFVRFALPVVPSVPVNIFAPVQETSAAAATALGIAPASTDARSTSAGRVTESRGPVYSRDSSSQLRPTVLLGGLWLAGVCVLVCALILGQVRLVRIARGARQVCDHRLVELLESCKDRLGVRAAVMIAESSQVKSPLLIGSIRPILLVPPGLIARLSDLELRSILLHELAHVRRFDIVIGWCVTLVVIAHWFNPFAWVAAGRMKADRELACDAIALAALRLDERPTYAYTLIALLEHASRPRAVPGLAAIAEDNRNMKRRILMATRFRPSGRTGTALSVALAAVFACVSLTSAQVAGEPAPAVPVGPVPAGVTGADVLRKVAETYATATTYEDKGVVTRKILDTSGASTSQLPFSTAFARSSSYLYEFRDGEHRYVVWSEGESVKSWWSLQPEVKTWDSVAMALAGPTGVSGGSATAMSTLLWPDLDWGLRLTALTEPNAVAMERVGDIVCFKIEGTQFDGTTMTVWVDAETYLIRQTFVRQRIDPAALGNARPTAPFTVETTMTFEPKVNGKIDAERFDPAIPE